MNDSFVHENYDFYPKLKSYLENSFSFQNTTNPEKYDNSRYLSPKTEIVGNPNRDSRSPFSPLTIDAPDYFMEDCKYKFLHFFIVNSKELKILHIDDALENKKWKSVVFKSKNDLPCYFNSVITPKG